MGISSEADNMPIGIGDRVGGDKITVGDIVGSVAAIGAGASVIYQKVERALSTIETRALAGEFENKRLAEALTYYVQRLERQATWAEGDPGRGNPYKALLEFDIQDAALFYGRDSASRELLAHVGRDQLTVLHAGSGVGKTSLLKAGIMPRLLADGHLPLYLRPYQTPIQVAIKRALLTNVNETPQLANASLHDFLLPATRFISGRQLVVIIDQFEELFTVQNEQTRNEFIDQLCTCLDDDLLPVRWIIALRDEWFGQLGVFRPRIRNPYANEFLLRPLSRAEAYFVITQPAARRKVNYEPALVERLMNDMGADEIAPPHLQLVCSMLFDMLENGQSVITQEMYEKAGEARGILREYLYRVLSRDMPKDMQAPAHRLLEALVTSEKRRALRTREDLIAELSAWGYPSSTVDQVLNQLTDSRLLRVDEFMLDNVHSVAAYELAHDYLLEEIDIDPEAQARKAAQELLTQKLPYYKRDKLLLSPHELAIILPQRRWLNLTPDGAALLRESEAVVMRQRRMRRVGIAVAVLVIIAFISSIAIQQKVAADQQATIAGTAVAAQFLAKQEANTAESAELDAKQQATISLSRKLASDAQLAKNLGEAIQAYQLAAQSYETYSTFESKNALYTALSLPLPERIFKSPGNTVDIVHSVNFNPTGDRIVTACSDNAARVWDVASGKELLKLEGHTKSLAFAAYSPDGTRIVTASDDGSIGIWDAQSGKQFQLIRAHKGVVASAVFSPDGSLIVTAGDDMTAALWDANSGKELHRFVGHEKGVRFANFSPDGKRIVTASGDGTARVWDTVTGREILRLTGHTGRVRKAAFNGDGTRIVTAGDDHTARVWDATTGKTLLILGPHDGVVMSANFSPDGRYIVTASQDSLVRLWDASNGALVATFSGQSDWINYATFSPDGKWIASASNDASVWLRKAFRISGSDSFIGHTGPVLSVNFSPDGKRFVTSSPDKTAAVWDVKSGKRVLVLSGHEQGVHFAVYSPDGTRIVTSSADGTVRIWDAASGNQLYQIPVTASSVNFNADGSRIVTAGEDKIARVWDTQTWKELLPPLEGHSDVVNFATFSPDGKLIVTVGSTNDSTMRFWDAKSHVQLGKFPIVANDEVNMVSFSPDGKRLVVAADPDVAQVWDVDTQKLLFQLKGHEADVASAAYSPDGKLIVTASEDHTLRLWDAMTGEPLAILQGHTDQINWATFSPDGKLIYSASDDRTIRTWPVDIEELHKFIRSELARLGY